MHLYLVRHGLAARAAAGSTDRERTLTDRGRAQLEAQRMALQRLAWPVAQVLHSPLVRAQQTAAALAPAFGLMPEEEPLLQPGVTLADVQEIAGRAPADAHLLLIGHQPDMGRLAYRLTGASVVVQEGIIMVIEAHAVRPQQGTLRGIYAPEDLAQLGRALPAT
jgi:phosphohistidine phosphatase